MTCPYRRRCEVTISDTPIAFFGIISASGRCNGIEEIMSKLSFKSFCIEFYARHIGSTGADVYRMFSESGLLKTLDDDYDDLHGLGWEALMPMFDEYLGRSSK